MNLRRIVIGSLATLLALAPACSSDSSSADTTTATSAVATTVAPETTAADITVADATSDTTTDTAATVAPTDPPATEAPASSALPEIDERIVVIGEEYLLADLLALGVTPIASTATVADVGFQGLDDYDTTGIEIMPGTEMNLEALAALEPDRIITLQFFADQIGAETLEGIAELTIIPDGLSAQDLVTTFGELFDRSAAADALITELEAAESRAADALNGEVVSLAAIYGGPSVAAFVSGPWVAAQTLIDAGATLVPTPAEAEPDRNGRAFISLEQVPLLAAPKLILLQTDTVEGESASVAELEGNPLWQQLPAVQAGAVTTLDRLGYPGIAGKIRLIDDLIAALA